MDKRLVWAVAFAVGICSVLLQRSLITPTILVAVSVTSVGLMVGGRGVIVGLFILGWAWGNVTAYHALGERISGTDFDGQKIVVGTVTGVPQRRGGLVRFDFQIDQIPTEKEGGYSRLPKYTWLRLRILSFTQRNTRYRVCAGREKGVENQRADLGRGRPLSIGVQNIPRGFHGGCK